MFNAFSCSFFPSPFFLDLVPPFNSDIIIFYLSEALFESKVKVKRNDRIYRSSQVTLKGLKNTQTFQDTLAYHYRRQSL